MCSLLQDIRLKATEKHVDTKKHATVLHQCFVSEPETELLQKDQWKEMVKNWVTIEYNRDIQNEEVVEVLEELDLLQVDADNNKDTKTDSNIDSKLDDAEEGPNSKLDALNAIDMVLQYTREQDNSDAIVHLKRQKDC